MRKNPPEDMVVTLRGDTVSKIEVAVPEGGGIAGILTQLGVGLPEWRRKVRGTPAVVILLVVSAPI